MALVFFLHLPAAGRPWRRALALVLAGAALLLSLAGLCVCVCCASCPHQSGMVGGQGAPFSLCGLGGLAAPAGSPRRWHESILVLVLLALVNHNPIWMLVVQN